MKTDILLFTQVMHSLLSSGLPLQDSLSVCSKILKGNGFIRKALKDLTEGKKLSSSLSENKSLPPLYASLVSIGEESGSLTEVFLRLSSYLKERKEIRRRIIQALIYPSCVLTASAAVVLILILIVIPELDFLFQAFCTSPDLIRLESSKITLTVKASGAVLLLLILMILSCAILRKKNTRASAAIDSAVLRIPLVRDLAVTLSLHDFCFAMKVLCENHFPLAQSLAEASKVPGNARIREAVKSACRKITCGERTASAFESEDVFPEYFTAWINTAEENGRTERAFAELSDYYRSRSEGMLGFISQAAEPVFILITGMIVISVILTFVLPVFRLLGAL